MATVEDYSAGGGGWYEFPGEVRIQGKEKAEAYLRDLEDLDSVEEDDSDIVESSDVTDIEEAAAESGDAHVEEVKDEVLTADGDEVNTNDEGDREFLVRMDRDNLLFEFVGKNKTYQFRRDAKILVVNEEDLGQILSQGGFSMVDPEAAKEYYS